MKKVAWLLVSCLIVLLLLSSCGIPQADYDAVVAERDAAQAQGSSLQSDLNKAQSELAEAKAQVAEAEPLIEELIAGAEYVDVESGVKIIFVIEPDMFPDSWLTERINASAESLENSQFSRSLQIILSAMRKYPPTVLRNNLEKIYVVRELRYFNITAGGTNSLNKVYVTNNGETAGYTDDFIEKTFHAEFSSILLRNNPEAFIESEWNEVNPLNFQYDQGGVAAIKAGADSTEFDPAYLFEGFLSEYSTSSLENDFNIFAQYIFTGSDSFWQLIETNSKIQRKLAIMIDFYRTSDPLFTEEYFRGLAE